MKYYSGQFHSFPTFSYDLDFNMFECYLPTGDRSFNVDYCEKCIDVYIYIYIRICADKILNSNQAIERILTEFQ